MAEAASQLDLQVLVGDDMSDRLVPTRKKKAIYNRDPTRYFLIVFLIGLLATLVRWLQQDFSPTWYPPILIILLAYLVIRREQIKGIYILTDQSLKVPYTWFYRRSIPYDKIVRVVDDQLTDRESGQSFAAIRIVVDTSLIKYNTTGMVDSYILLSTLDYDSMDINQFADEIIKRKREIGGTPNTLAQRLTDQVNRSWSNRWLVILFNTFDSTSEALIYILLIDTLIFGFFGQDIWPIFGGVLVGLYALFLFLYHIMDKPQAIIGIRPHELGPLIYDEEELVTSVRFIVMCRPFTVHLVDCEIIYPEDATKQVGRLNQIHPEYIEPGELTYGVAQMIGNHSKASGAVIKFYFKETEDRHDEPYEVEIEWA